jgi:hypothetical protein
MHSPRLCGVSLLWLCLLFWVVMGYLLYIFRLPDYNMPAPANEDAVLLALTKD